MQHYISTENKLEAILGPFQKSPIQNRHCSPLLNRTKYDPDRRRVIFDLSWPKGGSVNHYVDIDSYMGTKFQLKFPTVDNIVDRIVGLQGKCLTYKIDLQRAFCHLKLDPRDVNKTGIMFNNEYYVDTSIPFGYRHGAVCMQRVTDAIRFIMHKHGFHIFNYINPYRLR